MKRIEIGKKTKIKEPFERVKRTQCENCWHTESDCADCDYKMIYDAADEMQNAADRWTSHHVLETGERDGRNAEGNIQKP